MRKKILILLTVTMLIIACSGKEVTNNSIKISPSKLFQGETTRLEPHMDMITGCVDVQYKGNKDNIGVKYEIWENGVLESENNLLLSSMDNNVFNGEISISLKDAMNDKVEGQEKMKIHTVIRTESGYSASSGYIDRFHKGYGFSPRELPNEINTLEDEETIIWGLAASDGSFSSGENIEETARRAKWGLILKLYFE